MSFRLATIRGATWSALDSLGGQMISFAVFLILARLLTPADFGVVAIANIYVLVAQFFIFQGLGQAIIQFDDLDDAHLNTVFWINLTIGALCFVLTLCLAGTFATWFHSEKLGPILRGLSPVFLLAALADVQNNLLTRKMLFRTLAIRTFASYLLGGIVGIIMAFQGAGAWSLVGQQLTVWTVNLLTLWRSSEWRPQFQFCQARARRLLRFGGQLLWVDLVGLVNRRADQLFVGKFLGPVATGFYSVGSRVSMLVSEVLSRSIARVSLSSLSRLQKQADRFTDAFCELIEIQSVLIFPVAIGLAIVAPEVMQICFGGKWNASVPVMQALLLACPFDALSGAHQSALVAQGKPGWSSLLTTIHAITNIAAFAIAIQWGAVAVAVAYTIRSALLYPLELFVLRKALDFPVSRFLKPVFFQILLTALMAAALLFVRGEWFTALALPLSLFFSILTGIAAYTLMMLVLNRPLFDRLRQLIPSPRAAV